MQLTSFTIFIHLPLNNSITEHACDSDCLVHACCQQQSITSAVECHITHRLLMNPHILAMLGVKRAHLNFNIKMTFQDLILAHGRFLISYRKLPKSNLHVLDNFLWFAANIYLSESSDFNRDLPFFCFCLSLYYHSKCH